MKCQWWTQKKKMANKGLSTKICCEIFYKKNIIRRSIDKKIK